MLHLGKGIVYRSPNPEGGAVGLNILGILLFQVHQLMIDSVVFIIRNQRIIQNIVVIVVFLDCFGEFYDFFEDLLTHSQTSP